MIVSSLYAATRLQPSDHKKVEVCAARVPYFSAVTPYLFWLCLEACPDYCLKYEDQDGSIEGYCLSLPTQNPREIFIWQFAALPIATTPTAAARALGLGLTETAQKQGVQKLQFTLINKSASRKYMMTLLEQLGYGAITDLKAIPCEAWSFGREERLFTADVPT